MINKVMEIGIQDYPGMVLLCFYSTPTKQARILSSATQL